MNYIPHAWRLKCLLWLERVILFGRALVLGATIRPRAPDVSLVSSAHFDQPRHNIFKFFFFCLSDSDGCRAHSPSVVLLKYNNGNELLGVTAVHMWECGDWNGLPRKSSADAAEPLNQLRLLFHIYYSYFFSWMPMFNKRALHWVVSEIYGPVVHLSQGTIA